MLVLIVMDVMIFMVMTAVGDSEGGCDGCGDVGSGDGGVSGGIGGAAVVGFFW